MKKSFAVVGGCFSFLMLLIFFGLGCKNADLPTPYNVPLPTATPISGSSQLSVNIQYNGIFEPNFNWYLIDPNGNTVTGSPQMTALTFLLHQQSMEFIRWRFLLRP